MGEEAMRKFLKESILSLLLVSLTGLAVFADDRTVQADNTNTASLTEKVAVPTEKTIVASENAIATKPTGRTQYELDDVVITGTKTQLKIKDSPAAVSVVTKKDIDEKNVVYADDLLTDLPGVQVARTEKGDQSTSVQLRGLPGYERTLVLLDGFELNQPTNRRVFWNRVPIDLVERVEVVRGPFSSLYGEAALGGVINIITREPQGRSFDFKFNYDSTNIRTTAINFSDKPFDQFAYYLGFENESVDGYTYHQYVQKTATKGTSAIKATGYAATTDPYGNTIYNIGELSRTQIENNNYTGKFYYFPAKGHTISLLTNWSIWDQPTQYGVLGNSWLHDASGNPIASGTVELAGTGKVVTVNQSDFLRAPGYNTYWGSSLRYVGELSDVWGVKADLDYAYKPINIGAGTISKTATALTGSSQGTINPGYWETIADLQTDYSIERHHVIVGGQYDKLFHKAEVDTFTYWNDLGNYTKVYDSMNTNRVSDAVFAQDEWKILSSLSAFLGARVDNWSTGQGTVYDTKLAQNIVYEPRNYTHVSPKLSLVYKVGEAGSLRASAGNALHTPTVLELYQYSSSATSETIPNPNLKEEIDNAWEFGGEYTFPTKTTVSGTYFENYLTNLIYASSAISNGFTTTTNSNAGKAEIKGVEVEVKQQVTSDVSAFANYTFVNPRIVENSAVPVSVGKIIPNVSQHTANLGVEYKWERIEAVLSGTYASKRYQAADNSDTVNGVQGSYDPYAIANLQINYRFTGGKISFGIDNLTDVNYFTLYKTPGRTFNLGANINL
jgi:iron complex outermembrane receptor protein